MKITHLEHSLWLTLMEIDMRSAIETTIFHKTGKFSGENSKLFAARSNQSRLALWMRSLLEDWKLKPTEHVAEYFAWNCAIRAPPLPVCP